LRYTYVYELIGWCPTNRFLTIFLRVFFLNALNSHTMVFTKKVTVHIMYLLSLHTTFLFCFGSTSTPVIKWLCGYVCVYVFHKWLWGCARISMPRLMHTLLPFNALFLMYAYSTHLTVHILFASSSLTRFWHTHTHTYYPPPFVEPSSCL